MLQQGLRLDSQQPLGASETYGASARADICLGLNTTKAYQLSDSLVIINLHQMFEASSVNGSPNCRHTIALFGGHCLLVQIPDAYVMNACSSLLESNVHGISVSCGDMVSKFLVPRVLWIVRKICSREWHPTMPMAMTKCTMHWWQPCTRLELQPRCVRLLRVWRCTWALAQIVRQDVSSHTSCIIDRLVRHIGFGTSGRKHCVCKSAIGITKHPLETSGQAGCALNAM